jgi:quinol monooxygenase YgiN
VYLRLVRLHLRPGSLWDFREFYETRILPALAGSPGCLYAALLQPLAESAGEDCDSLTLWEGPAHADTYVASGLYDELLDAADPYLAHAVEWKADRAPVLPGDRPPLPDPEVEVFPVGVARQAAGNAGSPGVFLRVVDNRVEPARFDDFRRAYEESVAPALLETPGCLAAFLVEGARGKSQALSITLWKDEASAIRYEADGRFDTLVAHLRPYFSGLYQWRLSLAPTGEERRVTGADLDVRGYVVLAGRQIRGGGA